MAIFSKPQVKAFAILAALSSSLASPLVTKVETIKHLLGRDTFEWTALGDSYSSGVGAGEYQADCYRCLRYDKAYPAQINADSRLHEGDHQFNNVVCSGSSSKDIEDWQFLDEDQSGKPNGQYGTRPKFGNPSMATLSVGGNDIDFPGIIFNCILEWSLPVGGPEKLTCEKQREKTWGLLITPDLENIIAGTIKKTVDRGRKGKIGDKFKLYVTGFPQFFNTETTECDSVTFARSANPKDDGKEHTKMTQKLRKEYNDMSIQLNKAIEAAAGRFKDQGVTWVPIDGAMDGHRYCEPGIKEPDQHNDKLWLFHYPYNEPNNPPGDGQLEEAEKKVNRKDFKTYDEYQTALFDAAAKDGANAQGLQDPLWRWIGNRVKVFHPQIALHEKIRDLVLDRYVKDLGEGQTSTPPKPTKDENNCHGVFGDYWVMSRDTAVNNATTFCGQNEKKVTYNKDSVNELELSVKKLGDDSKGPRDAPKCLERFRDAVIDGCDSSDKLNNPHNYKFGSTLKTSDGWEYTMKPLSKQVNQVICDVWYKFLWDEFQLRGKNLPDAKFGANGEKLKDRLQHCGAITRWNFEWTPGQEYQWFASGRLPIGTKSCVGSALVDSGGANPGSCTGAGKRDGITGGGGQSVGKRDSIDDWPGYGDEGKHIFKHPATD